jgi:hypothetical protein
VLSIVDSWTSQPPRLTPYALNFFQSTYLVFRDWAAGELKAPPMPMQEMRKVDLQCMVT